jgi:hypothetical protein
VFCTDFNNANMFCAGRPASELNDSALTKVGLAFKAAKDHFDQCIALNCVDLTALSICGMIVITPAATLIRAKPEPCQAKGGVPPVQLQVDVVPKVDPPAEQKEKTRQQARIFAPSRLQAQRDVPFDESK